MQSTFFRDTKTAKEMGKFWTEENEVFKFLTNVNLFPWLSESNLMPEYYSVFTKKKKKKEIEKQEKNVKNIKSWTRRGVEGQDG